MWWTILFIVYDILYSHYLLLPPLISTLTLFTYDINNYEESLEYSGEKWSLDSEALVMILTYILFSTIVFQQNEKSDSKSRLRDACRRSVSLFVLLKSNLKQQTTVWRLNLTKINDVWFLKRFKPHQ